MSRFWNVFSRPQNEKNYDFSKLINTAQYDNYDGSKFPIQFICDIDKTYLETQFESLIKMARVALESAEAKITVAGAADVLMALRWGDNQVRADQNGLPRPIHFVSSSPPQLRPVLEEKLCIDGLDWTSDTFKNQAYNVRKGRVDQLKQHVAYKSAAILQVIKKAGDNVSFTFFGDNAESDAFIYLGAALRLRGRLTVDGYAAYLVAAGLDAKVAKDVATAYKELPAAHVSGIYIRNAPGYQFIDSPTLSKGIVLFDDYFQLTAILISAKLIPPSCLPELTRSFHNRNGFTTKRLAEHLAVLGSDVQPQTGLPEAIQQTLKMLDLDSAPAPATNCLVRTDLTYLDALNEEQIILAANAWAAAMHKEKQERRSKH